MTAGWWARSRTFRCICWARTHTPAGRKVECGLESGGQAYRGSLAEQRRDGEVALECRDPDERNHVAMTTHLCCNSNMEVVMSEMLESIFQRRASRLLDPIEIPEGVRGRILDAARVAPSSFNVQPYRFYWVQSPEMKTRAAQLCIGQSPAETGSALMVAVSDIGSWPATVEGQLEWMRREGFSEKQILESARKAKLAKWFFMQGWFGILG